MKEKTNIIRKIGTSLLFLCICMLLSSCTFSIIKKGTTLSTPTVGINKETQELRWYSVENAEKYAIYLNNKNKLVVDAVEGEVQSFYFGDWITDAGVYYFNIQSVTNNLLYVSSKLSESVVFVSKNAIKLDTKSDYNVIVDERYGPETTLNSSALEWEEVSEAESYIVFVYSNSTGLVQISTTDLYVDLEDIDLENVEFEEEIIAYSVGTVLEEESSDVYIYSYQNQYYNPQDQDDFSEQIYVFDGYLNDFYIENIEELNNVVYYNFISRQTLYDIRFSPACVVEIGAKYTNLIWKENQKIVRAINDSFDYFYETSYYDYDLYKANNSFSQKIAGTSYDYRISIDFFDIEECDLEMDLSDLAETYSQDYTNPTYYDIYPFEEKREEDYNNFVSDKYFLKTEVATTEELYHAVENQVTPICEPESRAELIYSRAKSVLREIISDDMTDYEKALAIFDWITIETVYEYINHSTYPYTQFSCYYLEGVFLKGKAVCDGFSKAYSLMCNMEGIECIRIVGSAVTGGTTGGHAWNKVDIDGDWYFVDITWTEFNMSNGYETSEYLAHKYFLVSDSMVSTTHFPWEKREKFLKYPTPLDPYGYYEKTKLEYVNSEGEEIEVSLLINSDKDLKDLLYYFVDTNDKAGEILVDKEYMITLAQQDGNDLISSFYNKVRALKPASLMLSNAYSTDSVNYSAINSGVLFVIEYSYLINDDGELETLIEHFNDLKEYNSSVYDFEIRISFDKAYLEEVLAEYEFDFEDIQEVLDQFLELLETEMDVEIVYQNEQEEIYLNGSPIPDICYNCILNFVESE